MTEITPKLIEWYRKFSVRLDQAIKDGSIKGNESFPATVTLEVAGLKLKVNIDDTIKLE